jgi:hypothetical protein
MNQEKDTYSVVEEMLGSVKKIFGKDAIILRRSKWITG